MGSWTDANFRMNPDDYEKIRRGLVQYFTDDPISEEANDAMTETSVELTRYEPESAWQLILATIQDTPAEADLGVLGAGPLEDLLSHHGAAFIDRIEQEALRSARFRDVLAHVWKSQTDEIVWQRLENFVLKYRDEWERERVAKAPSNSP